MSGASVRTSARRDSRGTGRSGRGLRKRSAWRTRGARSPTGLCAKTQPRHLRSSPAHRQPRTARRGGPRAGELADAWLQTHAFIAGDLGREVDGTTLQIAHFMDGVVGEDIPGVVVGDGHRKPVYPRSVSDIIEHRIYALVAEVSVSSSLLWASATASAVNPSTSLWWSMNIGIVPVLLFRTLPTRAPCVYSSQCCEDGATSDTG